MNGSPPPPLRKRFGDSLNIVAVTNIKGGVGKTTTAVNLAYLCSASGQTTLLWDLDPQGAATYTLQCEAGEGVSAKKLVSGKRGVSEVVVGSPFAGLDVIPADFSYRHFDVHLSEKKKPTERLLRMSRPAERAVFDALSGLPARHFAADGERTARGRCGGRAVAPDTSFGTHADSAEGVHPETRLAGCRCCRSSRWWIDASRFTKT